jgi:HEAT repeat protein
VSTGQEHYELDFDPKVLNRFIFLFNIARHHARSYPSEHPQIAKSIQNFLTLFDSLLEYRDEITIGVAKDNLIIGDASLERNAVFKDLANSLFECDIASFTIRRSVSPEELLAFYQLLALESEEIREKGGFSYLLRDAGVGSVKVLDIDYSSFHTTEMETIEAPTAEEEEEIVDMPWESFISGLIDGKLSADGEKATADELDPATLAQLMNKQKLEQGDAEEKQGEESYEATITSFFKDLDKEGLNDKQRAASMIRLGNFVDQLNPDLRRDLLNSTFATIGDRTELAEEMMNGISPSTLIEIFGEAQDEKIETPPGLLNLLAKLSENAATDATSARVIKQHDDVIDEEIEERVRTIFQSGNPGKFIPDEYQKFLQDVLNMEKLDDIVEGTLEELTRTLEGHEIEASVLNVILDLIDDDPMSEQADLMTRNLVDLVHYFIEVGDFDSLAKTYDRLHLHREESEAFSIPIAEETLKIYDTEEFSNAILEGLNIWGEEKHDAIRRLIAHIRTPFIQPLIERLGDEEDMNMRQYLMSVLLEIGDPAKEALIKKLHDPRWYLVRNIIILLRRYNDPAVMQPMKRLIGHKHPKIHFEAMKTYLHFKDPKADLYLIREMQSDDINRRKNAALLANNSSSPAVHQELINIVTEGRDDPEYELRSIALKSLAEIADPNFIPSLEKALTSRNLFRPGLHKEFKINLLSSLVKYPPHATRELLTRQANEPKGELADTARQVLRRLPKRSQA